MATTTRKSDVVTPVKRSVTRNNKSRGRILQQEVRDTILEAYPTLEPDDVRSVGMGQPGEDVMLSPAARKALGGFQIECKRVKTLKTIYNWVAQARSHGPHKPIVVTRADRHPALVILELDHFLGSIKK